MILQKLIGEMDYSNTREEIGRNTLLDNQVIRTVQPLPKVTTLAIDDDDTKQLGVLSTKKHTIEIALVNLVFFFWEDLTIHARQHKHSLIANSAPF